jgi:hypothetical protein
MIDHFGRTQTKAREKNSHRIIGAAKPRVGAGCREDKTDLLDRCA